MANEISVQMSLKITNGNADFRRRISKNITQAASGGPTPGFLTIGTSEESTAFAELTTEGLVLIENYDGTNYIEWGFSTGVYGGKIPAGEFALFRCKPGLTLYYVANTAACKAFVGGFEA